MPEFDHNFKKFPELTNEQMNEIYFMSPHKQITQDFWAKCVKVTDGDTVRVKADFRDFDFPVRFLGVDTKEINEDGQEAKSWLEKQILNKKVKVEINPKNRVDKWGRLLGRIVHNGIDLGNVEINLGLAVPFEQRNEMKLPNLDRMLNEGEIKE